jgi:lysophospholipase L1-like esterase
LTSTSDYCILAVIAFSFGEIMLDCLIVGDSIAVGTHMFAKECTLVGKGGINTWQWNRDYLKNDLTAGTVIISLGSNDHKHIHTEAELLKMRAKIVGKRVFWILPAGNLKASEVSIQYIQLTIKEIANKYGDTVLPITKLQPDGIHPSWAGYKQIADKIKSVEHNTAK